MTFVVCLIEHNQENYQRLRSWAEQDDDVELHWLRPGYRTVFDVKALSKRIDLYLIAEDVCHGNVIDLIATVRFELESTAPIFLLSKSFNANLRDVALRSGVSGWLSDTPEPPLMRDIRVLLEDGALESTQAPEKIDFRVKLGVMELEWTGEVLHCYGVLDENASLERLLSLLPSKLEELIIDWSGLNALNLEGVKRWAEFARKPEFAKTRFSFRRCPPVFLEFYEMMRGFFGESVRVESVCIPDTETLAQELEYETYFINNSQRCFSMGDVSRAILHGGSWPEREANEALRRSIWSVGSRENRSELERYFEFLATVHRCVVSELVLTRETILDQWSRSAARLNAHEHLLEHFFPGMGVGPCEREVLVSSILQSYDESLRVLVSIQGVFHSLLLKIRSHARKQTCPAVLNDFVQGWSKSTSDFLSNFIDSGQLLALEQSYDEAPSDLSMSNLLLGCFRSVKHTFVDYGSSIEKSGNLVFESLNRYTDINERIKVTDRLLADTSLTEPTAAVLFACQRNALLNLEIGEGVLSLLERSKEQCKKGSREIYAVISAMISHDYLSQVLQHRAAEMDIWLTGGGQAQLLELMKSHAVTVLEKETMRMHFPELDFGDTYGEMDSVAEAFGGLGIS